ncbi:MAG: hypothetical protein ACK5KR_05335 [Breznakia sp.]
MKEKWNQLIEKYGKNKVYGGCAAIVVTIIIIIVLFILSLNSGKKNIENFNIKKYSYTYELGKNINTSIDKYVENIDKTVDEKEIRFKFCGLKKRNETCKDYTDKKLKDLEVGKYRAAISYKENTEEITIHIKDTVAPKFSKFSEMITINQSKSEVDFSSYFAAEDVSKDVKISIASENVKYNTPGEYSIYVTAKDASNNKIKKKATVVVKEVEKEEPTYACEGGIDPNQECEVIIESFKKENGWVGNAGTITTADYNNQTSIEDTYTRTQEYAESLKQDEYYVLKQSDGTLKKYQGYKIIAVKFNNGKTVGYTAILLKEVSE